MNSEKVKQELVRRGVVIDCPESVSIDDSINPEKIAGGVVVNGGCRLSGAKTSIGPGSILGAETPVTLENCQLGHGVQLKGGFFSNAVMLDGVSFGSGAHVRGGTLLEEQASCAHTVGLKQTLLLPYATLGSLINFCDCMMTGGSSSKDHSEVGSSYIHFNFTAHQDKATPSMAGNIPQGVMLNQPPIFLGGQGGLVGPTRLAFGTVVAAGTVCRRDVLTPGRLVFGQTGGRLKETSYDFRTYGDISRIVHNNLIYIGNLHALYAWYKYVRPLIMADDVFTKACLAGAKEQIEEMVAERIKRLEQLAAKVKKSIEISGGSDGKSGTIMRQEQFVNQWGAVAEKLQLSAVEDIAVSGRDEFIAAVQQVNADNYLETVRAISPESKEQGTLWLQDITDAVGGLWGEITNG
jgi:UDP-N-acetylglucosamine/UDP-N-acetylgalactosamine diphosphorylase